MQIYISDQKESVSRRRASKKGETTTTSRLWSSGGGGDGDGERGYFGNEIQVFDVFWSSTSSHQYSSRHQDLGIVLLWVSFKV
jgi:hypothetical protein